MQSFSLGNETVLDSLRTERRKRRLRASMRGKARQEKGAWAPFRLSTRAKLYERRRETGLPAPAVGC